ncbi:hypothetical protein [Acidisoma sp. 7E03]
MSTDDTPIRFRKKRLVAYRGRGQLYSWLRAHRLTVAKGIAAGKLTWPAICTEAARHGVKSRDAMEPSQRAAAKAWQTVIQDLAADGLKPTDKVQKPVYPSRMAKWTPPAILDAIAAGNPAVRGGEPVAHPGANGKREQGFPLSQAPPPPLPPPKPPSDQPLSRYAKPDDPPHVKAALASIEAQLDREDWYLMAGKPRKRRTE